MIARDPASLAELAERPVSESHHESNQDASLVDVLIRILESVSSEGDRQERDDAKFDGDDDLLTSKKHFL